MSHDVEAMVRGAAEEPRGAPDAGELFARGARRRRRRRALSAAASLCLFVVMVGAVLRPLLAPDESRVVLDRADPPASTLGPTAPPSAPPPTAPPSPSPSPSASADAEDEESGPGRTAPAPAPGAPARPAPASAPDTAPAPDPAQPEEAASQEATAPPPPEPEPDQSPAPLCPPAAVNVVPVVIRTYGGGPVTVRLQATPDRACVVDMTVQATLSADAQPFTVAGNPATARLRSPEAGQAVVADAVWDQWCGDPDLQVFVRAVWPGHTISKEGGSPPACSAPAAPSSLGPFEQRAG